MGAEYEPVHALLGQQKYFSNFGYMTFGHLFAAPTNQGGFGYTEVTANANMRDLKGYGAGANLGVIFKPNDQWTLCQAYTSPAKMILKGKAVMDMTLQFNAAFGQIFTNMGINLSQGVAAEYGKNTSEFRVPQKLGFGICFKLRKNSFSLLALNGSTGQPRSRKCQSDLKTDRTRTSIS